MPDNNHYSVYVIELQEDILNIKKFRDENPDYIKGKSCIYVGMTGIDVADRLKQHKEGYKSSRYVKKFGMDPLPELYEQNNPMTFYEARDREIELAEELRQQGYGVWQK